MPVDPAEFDGNVLDVELPAEGPDSSIGVGGQVLVDGMLDRLGLARAWVALQEGPHELVIQIEGGPHAT